MTGERAEIVRRLFDAARALDAARRIQYLDDLSEVDPELRKEVDVLLASPQDGVTVPDIWPHQASPAVHPLDSPAPVPDHIGPYRVVRQIGEGGMGVVFEADQEHPVRRRVALKLIKWGMDTGKRSPGSSPRNRRSR